MEEKTINSELKSDTEEIQSVIVYVKDMLSLYSELIGTFKVINRSPNGNKYAMTGQSHDIIDKIVNTAPQDIKNEKEE